MLGGDGSSTTPATPGSAGRPTGRLGPAERDWALGQATASELDVLVVGGGVVGTGVALDAVTRGLSVALVEARDFASGTSSRSSKLIHGGLRYLEMLDFGLVREALAERSLLIQRLAPHLVKPVPFLYPLTHHVWERAYVGVGLAVYDGLAGASSSTRGLPRHRHLSKRRTLREFPSLRPDALTGAVEYYDAQVDDARHTMTIARTAAAYGAHVINRCQVVGFLREGERVTGAQVRDLDGGGELDIRARQVINATGVWTDETQGLAGERSQIHVRASKGIHLVVPRDRIHGSRGLILRTETSVLFVIPWGRHWIIGTTDTDWDLDKAHPAASRRDIDYLLDHVNRVLVTPLERADVEGVYAGLRPLLAGESEMSSQLSREHMVSHAAPGLVVVAGGKYTTYRIMARDAVDSAVHGLGGAIPASCTEHIPLLGADGYVALFNARSGLSARSGIHLARIEHLLGRYGTLVYDLLQLMVDDPTLAQPLTGADDFLRAEVVYAASHEGARHLEDVLTRRTRISIETWDRGLSAALPAATLMAPILGWDDGDIEREVEHYRARVVAERRSQEADDDLAADHARLGAEDITQIVPLT